MEIHVKIQKFREIHVIFGWNFNWKFLVNRGGKIRLEVNVEIQMKFGSYYFN